MTTMACFHCQINHFSWSRRLTGFAFWMETKRKRTIRWILFELCVMFQRLHAFYGKASNSKRKYDDESAINSMLASSRSKKIMANPVKHQKNRFDHQSDFWILIAHNNGSHNAMHILSLLAENRFSVCGYMCVLARNHFTKNILAKLPRQLQIQMINRDKPIDVNWNRANEWIYDRSMSSLRVDAQ